MIQLSNDEFFKFVEFMNKFYGIDLSEKRSLIEGRLQVILAEMKFENFTQYYDYIVKDKTGIAVSDLINKLTTNHTFFMRETHHFDYLSKTVLPMLERNLVEKDIRIWSAGCSSGEEPYTIAILLDQFLGNKKIFWDSKVLATDISAKVLDIAVSGIYSEEHLKEITPQWKSKYFKKVQNGQYQVIDRIKEEVIYRRFNLKNSDFPFKRKFHVIFCRNVLIYFDEENKETVIRNFYNSLENGGYLFIGHSETLSNVRTNLKYIMPAVYRKEL